MLPLRPVRLPTRMLKFDDRADLFLLRPLAETLHIVRSPAPPVHSITRNLGRHQSTDRPPRSVVIPALLLASINAKNLWDEHWEHWEHLPPLEERVEYSYQNIRTKPFFWGDGDKVRLALRTTEYQWLAC